MVDPFPPDALRGFGDGAVEAAERAVDEARTLGHPAVGTEHLLLGLLVLGGDAAARLVDAGATLAAARHKVAEAGSVVPAPEAARSVTARAARALHRAVRFSHVRRAPAVGDEDVLLGVIDVEGTAGQILRRLGVDVDRLRAALTSASRAEADDAAPDARAAATRPEPARAETVRPPSRPAPAPLVCPSCGVELRDHVARHEVSVDRDYVAFGCASCGALLGFAPR